MNADMRIDAEAVCGDSRGVPGEAAGGVAAPVDLDEFSLPNYAEK
jgi:hypothetical protein